MGAEVQDRVERVLSPVPKVMRTIRIWMVVVVTIVDCAAVVLLPGPWNYYWLFAVGCCAVLNLYWSYASRHMTPTLPKGAWILWIVSVAEYLLYCLPLSSVPVLGQRFMPRFVAVEICGAVICVSGVAFSIWARRVLGTNWHNVPALRETHALVQTGPYAIVRHPIYLGFMLVSIGVVLVLGEVRALVVLLDIVVSLRKMKPEEEVLRKTYPDEYPDYERRVKRLVPFVW